MRDYYLISPTKYLDVEWVRNWYFHLVEALVVRENIDIYKKFCKSHNVILDSGIYITGEAMDVDKFIDTALKIEPYMVILPDVWGDAIQTIRDSMEFLGKIGKYSQSFTFMIVPHGNNILEWARCYRTLSAGPNILKVGLTVKEGLRGSNVNMGPLDVHWLGLHDIRELSKLGGAVSIDTSLPWRAAKKNVDLQRSFGTVIDDIMDFNMDVDLDLAQHNFEVILKKVNQ